MNNEKWKQIVTQYKKQLIVGACGVVLVGVGGFAVANHNQQVEKARVAQAKKTNHDKVLNELKASLKGVYVDYEGKFLAKDAKAKLESATQKFEKQHELTDSEALDFKQEFDAVAQQIKVQDELNAYATKGAIEETTVGKDIVWKNDLSKPKVNIDLKQFSNSKWLDAVKKLVSDAQGQFDAKKALDDAVKNAEKNPSRENVQKAKDLAKKVRGDNKAYETRLNNVLKGIDEREAQAKAEAEEAQRQEELATAQSAQQETERAQGNVSDGGGSQVATAPRQTQGNNSVGVSEATARDRQEEAQKASHKRFRVRIIAGAVDDDRVFEERIFDNAKEAEDWVRERRRNPRPGEPEILTYEYDLID